MELLDHSNEWIKGELFEAKLIVTFASLTIISALLFYFVGNTAGAKAMLFPLLVVGLMFMGIGGGMLYSNPKRVQQFEEDFKTDKNSFITTEIERVESFKSWYPITRWIVAGLGIVGVLIFIFWATPVGRAIGIGLILMMLATFVVDHFSEERAEIYYNHLQEHINT